VVSAGTARLPDRGDQSLVTSSVPESSCNSEDLRLAVI